MKGYVVCFVFNLSRNLVLLIKKNRPAWQRGMLNGIGGKVEPGETPVNAATRETQEECGLRIEPEEWNHAIHLTPVNDPMGEPCVVDFFYAQLGVDRFDRWTSLTDEAVNQIRIDRLDTYQGEIIPNLLWMIPLCLNMTRGAERAKRFHVVESLDDSLKLKPGERGTSILDLIGNE